MPADASWRPLPEDPRSLVGWTLRAALEMTPQVLTYTLLALIAVALVVLFCGLGVPPDLSGNWSWPRKRGKAPAKLASLAPAPACAPWYPVCVQLLQRGVRIGEDQGVATFFDGWLVFEGRRTAFSLRNVDAIPLGWDRTRFRLTNGDDVELLPYDEIGSRTELRQCFEAALRRWSCSDAPLGDSLLPPTPIHPWAWGQVYGAILVGTLLTAGAGALATLGAYWILAIASMIALCGLWRLGQGLWSATKLATITRRRSRAPRCANAKAPAGTPSSPCRPGRSGAWR